MRRPVVLAAALALISASALAATQTGILAQIAGRYERSFKSGDVSGDTYSVTDVVEIVPQGSNRARVSMELNFFNGHSCDIEGVANVEGQRLVLRAPELDMTDGTQCRLVIWKQGNMLRWSDGQRSCANACGARGVLDNRGAPMPMRLRRPL